jgi:glucokinase
MNSASQPATVLAGDIGGTNARLRIARFDGARLGVIAERSYRVADFGSLEEALDAFIGAAGGAPVAIDRACFALAGPIAGDRAKLTNAPWTIDARSVAKRFAIARVRLVNDFHAAAAGIVEVAFDRTFELQRGVGAARAPRLVIGAGTGLGVAYAIPAADRFRIVPGEGGHVGFAPADDEQIELARFAHRSLGRVEAEHFVSGPGIVRLYAFATAASDIDDVPDDVARDGSAAVALRADAGEPAAKRALGLFAAIFGAVAGDHALAVLAAGGVYIAGGVAAKLTPYLADATFVAAFNAKGAHAALTSRMPVRIVRDEHLGLAGAARLALEDDA